MKVKWLISIALMLIILVLTVPLGVNYFLGKQIEVPANESVEVVWTDQNWTKEQWEWWYHISQGSAFESVIPYQWFIALEQPKISFFKSAPKLIDSEFLAGFGLLPDKKRADNPDALPVGLAKTENFVDYRTGKTTDAVGFTCAACHTGQINYQGKGIRIEGGPNMIDVNKFKKAVGLSLLLTDIDPFRFNRFADNVLGEEHTAAEKAELKEGLKALVKQGAKLNELTKDFYPSDNPEGFGRLDALVRIGNFVFGTEINPDNYRIADGPVSYPHIWSSPWLDWIQYNGSVMQPMTRNAGEAMGVFSQVNFDPNSPQVFESNVNVENIFKIEELLTGESIFTGLSAPKWPEEILGKIDQTKAATGKKLYENYCMSCHLPPMDSEEFKNGDFWTTLGDSSDRKYLQVTMKNLYEIGTDPKTAESWYQRTVNLDSLPQKYGGQEGFEYNGIVTAGFALPFVVDETVSKKYDQMGLTPEEREKYNGLRPNLARAPLAYKARPLNGIWATAPFLHNGSVPNLYEMFLPADKRTDKFYLGSKEFDPQLVGFKKDKIKGGFLLDTSKVGNSNAGHEFKGDGTGPGVVGPELSEDERWALIEYLKTL